MFVPVSVFTDEDDKRKESTAGDKKHYYRKTEPIVSKMKVENNELDNHKEDVQVNIVKWQIKRKYDSK